MNNDYLLAINNRGICPLMQEVKMRNLARVSKGGMPIKAIRHDLYDVKGRLYNPYTDEYY